jgi:hypothetical protein
MCMCICVVTLAHGPNSAKISNDTVIVVGVGRVAPNFVYKKVMPPEKNKSTPLNDGAIPYPPKEQFLSEYNAKLIAKKTAGQPGYQKAEPFKIKEVQIQLGTDKRLRVKEPSSHVMYQEPDMRAANVRNMRPDGLRAAGLPRTKLPYYNIVPGVGNDDPNAGRCIFDAYQDHTNKFRDTRRFAQMNNPRIPRSHSYNPLTGDVFSSKQAPKAELHPRDPLYPPPLASLGQVRPPNLAATYTAKSFLETRPF